MCIEKATTTTTTIVVTALSHNVGGKLGLLATLLLTLSMCRQVEAAPRRMLPQRLLLPRSQPQRLQDAYCEASVALRFLRVANVSWDFVGTKANASYLNKALSLWDLSLTYPLRKEVEARAEAGQHGNAKPQINVELPKIWQTLAIFEHLLAKQTQRSPVLDRLPDILQSNMQRAVNVYKQKRYDSKLPKYTYNTEYKNIEFALYKELLKVLPLIMAKYCELLQQVQDSCKPCP